MNTHFFQIRLKTLTPIHIGSGETINKLDYFLEAGNFWRVNFDTLFTDPAFQDMRKKFLQSAPSGQPIDQLVPKPLLKKHILYKIPISQSAQNTNLIEARLFIKSAGRVYIPGSSLKGAILSALCWDILRSRKNDAEQVLERDSDPLGITIPALGGAGSGKFTHWLDISDSDFKMPADCLELSLAKVTGARRGELPILYETLKPQIQFTFTFKLPPQSKLTPETLLNKVNEFYQQVLEKDRLRGDIPFPHQKTLIRLGQGSGMFATALLILAQELNLTHIYRLPKIGTCIGPRTRKRILATPMGWAEMEVV